MLPNSTPKPDKLPGVEDYQVTIPICRDDTTASELRLRLPADSEKGALMLGGEIARYLATAIRNPSDGPQHAVAVDQVHAERVDTPSVDQLLDELEHWKRVITALARKMPGTLAVTEDEYTAADITDLVAVPAGDQAMLFITPAFYAELAAATAAEQHAQPAMVAPGLPVHEEPLLLPAGNEEIPVQPGGPDPDIRRVRVGRLGEFPNGTVEILVDGWWLPVENVITDGGGIELTLDLRNTNRPGTTATATYFDPTVLLPIRPATTLTGGYALARHHRPSVIGQQLLDAGIWWTIRQTGLNENISAHTVALFNADHGNNTATIDRDARILIRRRRRPGAWS